MKKCNRHRYNSRRNKRKLYLIIVCSLLLSIGLGYAYLQSALSITGTTKISKNSWNVHFENLISADNTKVSIVDNNTVRLNVTLSPGESFEYTVDVVNSGTIDAKIGSITPITVPAAYQDVIEYSLNYDHPADGETISINDVLMHGTSETIKFTIKYKDEEELESDVETVTLNLNFTINYVQADNNITQVEHTGLPICRKATTLHKTTCQYESGTYGCLNSSTGYSSGSEITYGHTDSSKLVDGTLENGTSTGYALDCDLTGRGKNYTERFYYISDMMYYDTTNNTVAYDSDYATLIYYSNIVNKAPSSSLTLSYYSSNENWHGASTDFMSNMPTSSEWVESLKRDANGNSFRQIVNQNGTTSGDGNTYENYNYSSYGARLLTRQEINAGCGAVNNLNTACEFLLENTKYEMDSGAYGYWLDTPYAYASNSVFCLLGRNRSANNSYYATDTTYCGVRPAIEVPKSRISFE